MKNKKGFTLVELLAVIVILALIMSIAVISIGGVLQSTRQSTFKETAASIVDGVQKQLLVANELKAGDYVFKDTIIEKGGDKSPLGGDIKYAETAADGIVADNQIGTSPVYRANGTMTCSDTGPSFVHVTYDENTYKYTYSICLAAGQHEYYIYNAELSRLLDSKDTKMIYKDGKSINS